GDMDDDGSAWHDGVAAVVWWLWWRRWRLLDDGSRGGHVVIMVLVTK
ncbi:hypothetical protein Tco_0473457, partial [Tanacetum coccineum]